MSDKKHGRFWGETTAFLALFLDNAGVLIFLNAILVFTFKFPVDIILGIPTFRTCSSTRWRITRRWTA